MEQTNQPPSDVYAGSGSVTARPARSREGVNISFSGSFTLSELGPIIAWAVGDRSDDRIAKPR